MNRWKQGTVLGFTGFALLGASLMSSPLYAQEAQIETSYTLRIEVFEDANSSTTKDTEEALLTDWNVALLNAQMEETNQFQLATSDEITVQSPPYAVCIAPQEDWLQTAPSTTVAYPNSNWDCHPFAESTELYSFGVFSVADQIIDGELEDIGQIIPPAENETSKDVQPEEDSEEAIGAVLGATSEDPDVLAATGEAATLLPLAGIIIALVALIIRQDSSRYRRY